jgi:ATP-binding protein involved in chromosome partitioning
MSEPDPMRLLQPAATRVRDPRSGRSIWLAGIVRRARIEDDTLHVELAFGPQHPVVEREGIVEALVANLRGDGFFGPVVPTIVEAEPPKPAARPTPPADPIPGMSGPGMAPHGGPIVKKELPGVRHIIAVASGKGGVGKSTVACNLAVGLRLAGLRVGLLDADIYGPSLPVMMNVSARPMLDDARKLVPATAYGVRCMSMGLVVDPNEAMIWRGPMVMGVVRQFLQDTSWGELDVLVVDLPPGTGDVQLTLIQGVDLSGAVIVTTPQEVALADAVRGIQMFSKLSVPLLGLVENMAYYELPDGTRDFVFGQDGGKRTAARYGTELLGEVPLRTAIRQGADAGLPAVLGRDTTASVFQAIAARVAVKLGLGESLTGARAPGVG